MMFFKSILLVMFLFFINNEIMGAEKNKENKIVSEEKKQAPTIVKNLYD